MDIFDTVVATVTSISGHEQKQEMVAQNSIKLFEKQQKASILLLTDILGTVSKGLLAYLIFILLPYNGVALCIALWLCYKAWRTYEPTETFKEAQSYPVSSVQASMSILKSDVVTNLGNAVIIAAFVHNDVLALVTAILVSLPVVLLLRYKSHKNWKGVEHLALLHPTRFKRFGLWLQTKTLQLLVSLISKGFGVRIFEALRIVLTQTSRQKFFGFIVYGIFTWTAAYVLLGEPLLTPRFYLLSEDERIIVSFVIEFFSFAPIVLPWFYKNVIKK